MSSDQFDVSFMLEALKASLSYTHITILLSIIPFIFGIIFGTLIALARFYKVKVLDKILQIFIVIIKGTPVVLLLIIINMSIIQQFDAVAEFFKLPVRSKDINPIYIALFALSLFATVNISETIRGTLAALDKGQYEAAYSVGLTNSQTLRRIILPQALPVAVPMLCNNLIGIVKGSSLAFMISVTELLNAALITATTSYKFLEAYVAAAIVYWVLCVAIEKGSYILEKRLKVYIKTAS